MAARPSWRSATALVRVAGRAAAPVGRRTSGRTRTCVAEARTAVDALRREYDALVAEHRRETQPAAARTASCAGPLRRLQRRRRPVRAAGRAGGRCTAGTCEVLDRVAAHARLTARLVVGAAETVLPGPVRPAARRSTPARATSRRCCRCWRLRAGPPGSGRARRRRARRRSWSGCGGRPSPPTSSSGRCAAGRPRSARWAACRQRCAARPTSAASTGTSRCCWPGSALSDDEQRWLDSCLLVRAQLARVRATRDPDGLGPTTAQLLVFDPTAYGYEGRVALVGRRRRHRRQRGVPGAGPGLRRSAARWPT